MFDFNAQRSTTGSDAGLRPTTGMPGPQQMQMQPTPWARNSAAPPIQFTGAAQGLGSGQAGVLAQQQALAAQLRQQGTAELAQRAALKQQQQQQHQAELAAVQQQGMMQPQMQPEFRAYGEGDE